MRKTSRSACACLTMLLFCGLRAHAEVVTYQKGDGKGLVSETDDTTLRQLTPNTPHLNGTDVIMEIDQSDHLHAVLKFPNIFGDGSNQIPYGSLIISATLTLRLENDGTDCPLVYQLAESWNEAEATWNSRKTAVSWTVPGADGASHTPPLVGVFGCTTIPVPSTEMMSVTQSVQNWSNGEPNEGWVFVNDANNDGINYMSSEQAAVADRPLLTVNYLPAVYYSVGTNAADLKNGSPTISITSGVATLSVAQTGHVGVGDVIDYDSPAKQVYIWDVVSQTQFRVQNANGTTPANSGAVSVNSIKRAFNSISSAVAGSANVSHLGNANLTVVGRRLTWVCYKDGVFNESVTIDGYTTSASHFVTLTVASAAQVASGVSQRHTGVEGTGTILRPPAGNGIDPRDDFLVVEWLEIDGSAQGAGTPFGVNAVTQGINGSYRNLLVHDFDQAAGATCLYFETNGQEIRNSIVYRCGRGIQLRFGDNNRVVSSTFYDNLTKGVYATDTSIGNTVENVISVGSVEEAFVVQSGGAFSTFNNNLSGDATAGSFGGSGNLVNRFASNLFESIIGTVNLHLRLGSDAIDVGKTQTSFSDDVDGDSRPFSSAWDIGADESPLSTVQLRFSSIGTNAGNLHAVGNASVPLGSRTVTFTSPLPAQTAVGAVGMGDVLVIQGETLFIEAYVSPTQVLLQRAATVDHSTPTSTFTVTRAFNTLSSWETGRGGNLVGQNRREIGVAYKDSQFAENLTIDGNTVDSTRFMHLTVAPGQRHNGTAGTGVALNGQAANRMGIEILSNYTRVEWFDLFNHRGATGYPTIRVSGATNVLIQNVIARDFFDASSNTEGIAMLQGAVNGMTVRNCIIYNGDSVGFEGDDGDDTLVIQNCTIYNMSGNGISQKNGTPIVATNVISMGNGGLDFSMPAGTQAYNISDDGSANCGTCKPTENPAVQFQTLGSDFHLAGTSTAINAGTDLSASFCCDIDNGLRPAGQWDIGADELGVTTEVALVSFTAVPSDGEVVLTWETASELRNLGFHLHRATTANGPYERLTDTPIPGLGTSPHGAKYRYRDSGLSNGVTYHYQLEDIETSGRTKLHGPVSATPSAGASPASLEEGTLITFGDPAASSLAIRSEGPRGLVLELSTEGFHARVEDDGSVRIEIPGFDSQAGSTGLEIPVKRAWVDAVAGRKVEIRSVSVEGVERFSSFKLVGGTSELVSSRGGIVSARRRRVERTTARPEPGLVPAESAVLSSVGFQRDVKKALVELAPLRWDPSSGELLLAHRLVVRLSFHEREPSELSTGGARGRRSRPAPAERRVLARLKTMERGLYRVRYEDVMRRRRGFPANELRVSRQGRPAAFHLEPDANRFEPGSVLYFLSEGGAANPYEREAVYELELSREGVTMERIQAAPSGEAIASYRHRTEWEENRFYQAALLDAPDPWLWDLLFAPASKSFFFELRDLAPPIAPAKLAVWLQGASDFPVDPDHHVRISVNGGLLKELSWDGKQARSLDVEVPAALLKEGVNELQIENVGDTAATYSMVMLDRFALEYSRIARTDDGRLEGRFLDTGTAEIGGLSPGSHVIDVSEARPKWLTGFSTDATGVLRARVQVGHRYLAVSPESVRRPVLTFPASGRLRDSRRHADYVLIGPDEFLRAAAPLLKLRQEQGLSVAAVSIDDVYSEFGFGESTPEAIREFLSYAYHEWKKPSPRYVLLLGDASYDFKDALKTGVQNHVPPRMVKTSYLWTASDPSYGMVNGDDVLPDLSIGRLPAASVEEVRTMVGKIVAYESSGARAGGAFLLVADNPDAAGNFEADADRLAATVLSGVHPSKIYLSQLGTSATRAAILDGFDRGASFLSYIGHGGIHLWADENFFHTGDVVALSPQEQQPLVLTMNCLNGYFHFPYFDSLAESLVKAEGKGAIAAFSPSGLSLNGPAGLYHEAALRALVQGRHQRLGDALLEAQSAYLATGALPELLSIYHLIGDPALVLPD